MNNIIEEDMQIIYEADIEWEVFKDKTIFITGAYGMIASYMVVALLYANTKKPELNIKIVAGVRSKEKGEKRFKEWLEDERFEMRIVDITRPIENIYDIDYIIHAASFASPQYYNVNPVGTLLPNVMGTYYLLELARKEDIKGFLFFSSGEVYGEVKEIDKISETDFGYLDPMEVRSCYGESKRMGENMCKSWQHQYGIPTKVVRIYHTYGPTMDIYNDERVFSEFVANVVNDQDIIMKSDGTPVRPFCYLSDAVIGLFKIILKGIPGEAYNLCNSENLISVRGLADILVTLYPEKGLKVIKKGREEKSVYMENMKANKVTADMSKLKKLGWEPKYSIPKGFKRTIDSFLIS